MRITFATTQQPTGTAAKTMFQVLAGANSPLVLEELAIGLNGQVTTDEPLILEILRQSTGGSGGVTCTPKKVDSKDTETIQASGLEAPNGTWTGEPTAGDVLYRTTIHPQAARRDPFVLTREFPIPGGGRLGVRLTAAVAVEAVVTAILQGRGA